MQRRSETVNAGRSPRCPLLGVLPGDPRGRARAARLSCALALWAAAVNGGTARAAESALPPASRRDVQHRPRVNVAPASEAASPDEPGRRSGFSFDLRLGAGLARVGYDESARPIADFDAVALGGAMRFGSFLNPHVVLGAELAFSWGSGVGELRVRDPSFFGADGYPSGATYGSVSPLGVFVDMYPWESEGIFLGLAGGVGFMDLPSFGDGGGGVMARYALEVGYELGGAGKQGPAVYLRHERWAGSELPVAEDRPDGLVSRELLVGLRWSFWSPVWHPPTDRARTTGMDGAGR